MTKHYVYIDDSGDPGLGGGGSSNFIIASVVIVGQENRDSLIQTIDQYKEGLGWKEREELKFHKTHKDVIRLAIKTVNKCSYDGVRGPKYTKRARTYLRQELKNSMEVGRISFEDSRSNPLVQLADLIAGSVARSLTDKADAGEYVKLFGRKLKKIFKG